MKTDFKTINYKTYKTRGGKQSQPDSKRLTRIGGLLFIVSLLIPFVFLWCPDGFLATTCVLSVLLVFLKRREQPSSTDSIFDIPNAGNHFAPGYLDCGAIYSSLVDPGNTIDDIFPDSSWDDSFGDI